jgi:NAD(P)-dependent dehydrogenase (short-subunit alcohol dehydrogenase family)
VYAGTRGPLAHPDERVTPLNLDVTNEVQIREAAYGISKAAAFSLTQSLRALLAGRGVRVHAVLTGPVESAARAIFDGVEKEEEDIFPDPVSESIAESWRNGAVKALERELAAAVAGAPAG